MVHVSVRRYSRFFIFCLIFSLLLTGCNSFQNAFLSTNTPTFTATASSTLTPTITSTQTLKPTATATTTPKPTKTPKPTPTLVPGVFTNPLSIGDSALLSIVPEEYRKAESDGLGEIEFTLLDVKTGAEADQLAREILTWSWYETPIEGQEYLAIYGRLNYVRYRDNYEVQTVYPYFNLTLRYSDEGSDTWAKNVVSIWAEGYPPIEGEGWAFYLIRQGSSPFLYFQPYLISSEQAGLRSCGVYFRLFPEGDE